MINQHIEFYARTVHADKSLVRKSHRTRLPGLEWNYTVADVFKLGVRVKLQRANNSKQRNCRLSKLQHSNCKDDCINNGQLEI